MNRSESITQLSAALIAFQKEATPVIKTRIVPTKTGANKYKYANLSDVQDAIREPLANNGLCIIQMPDGENGLTTLLTHTSGEFVESHHEIKVNGGTPQDAGSVLTYMRRYAIAAVLNISIDEDDDAAKASQPKSVASMSEDEQETVLTAISIARNLDEIIQVYNNSLKRFPDTKTLVQACKDRKSTLGL